jgi:two-component system CheB/CheR fusion protein
MATHVVGIGASAGGLEALSELLGALPAGTGIACVVVQHLDPRHQSLLPEILAKTTPVPVTLALDGEVVQSDRVYIIPPNATLTVADHRFHLTKRPAFERHLPVDALFKSLALAYAECAIGVVLSGGDSDGSLGIQAIKHEGGIVFAQSPESARFPDMPRHAIETGCVDRVLTPAQIAHELVRLTGQSSLERATLGTIASGDDEPLKNILQRLRAAHRLDFTHYKRSTLRRRLDRRMTLRGINNLEEYCTVIDGDPEEMAALYQDFLIRVTEFFRDAESFEALRREVFPALREGRNARQPIRIWVPGCATGEEVYSIAIELLESLGDRISPSEAQIFGTDVSEVALEKARAGVYLANVVRDVSSERLQRFFERHDNGFRIVKAIRDLCIFARQDVTHDPPFSHLDLVSCRNLLIYLDEVAQRRILQAFHFALRPQGVLIIGPAESIAQSSELFEQVDKRFRIYRKRPGSGLGTAQQYRGGHRTIALASPEGDLPLRVEAESLTREAERWLLARFAPASVLVDGALNIRQFRGRTGPFLEPSSGPPSQDLRRVVRPELLVEMLPAIRQASETGVSVRRDAIRLDERDVSIEVVPLAGASGAQGLLILLDDGAHPPKGRPQLPPEPLSDSEKDRRLAQLQHEIEALRDYLRLAIEEHGAVEEELRSAHEEMLSANEEYQSTNEELETSKEELQSTNEELTTTIEELRNRNRDLGILNVELDRVRAASERALAYADAIVETVRAPLAVIDGDLKIKRVNRAFAEDLEIAREDVEGHRVDDADIGQWNIPELPKKLNAVLRDGKPMEECEATLNLPIRGRRVVTMNARRIPGDRDRTHLVLLAVDDVTERANVTADLLVNSQRKDEFLAILAHELRHPLTPITHAIHLLRLADSDPAIAALHETIDTQSRRLVRFVNELVDVVRADRGFLEIARERLDLVEVVQQAAASVQPLVEGRRHALTLALPRQPIPVDGDASRLNQVVSNLLDNAAKYTEPGGHITLTLEQQRDEAVLSVRDNGVGISQGDLSRIFEPFTQADSTLGRSGGGLGLGLSLVRRVIGLHGGRVEARSGGLAAGSEFIVWLPTASRKETTAPEEGHPAKTSASGAVSGPRKVLIVDDREEITRSLTRLIGAWGHEVAVARDAESALTVATAFEPDCAIVDLAMPAVSGYDLARSLREALPAGRLLLIAYTGSGDASVHEKCLAAGFDMCLLKPGDPVVLEDLLRTA